MFRKRLQFETLEDRRVCALVFGDGAANLQLGKDFPYLGWVERTDAGKLEFGGSSVLVAPKWVLMSAHQIFRTSNDLASKYEGFRVGFGLNYFSDRGENQSVSQVFVNPTYTDVAKGFDLALLYFEQPFSSVSPIDRYSGQIAIGEDASIAGFGYLQDANDSSHTQTLTGNRYAGNNAIDSLTDIRRPGYVRTSLYSLPFLPEYRENQMGARPGDSGGALIIQGKLAGITARAIGDGANAFTQYSPLDNAWIDATIASKAKKWQNEASPLDVNADGSVTALDALLVINFLNTQPGDPPEFQKPYLDVNGDDAITAIDALFVINALNTQAAAEGESNDEFFADWNELDRLTKLRSPLVQIR